MTTKKADTDPDTPEGSLPSYDTDTAKTQQERLEADPALEPGLAHLRDEKAREQEPEPHSGKETKAADKPTEKKAE